MRNIGSYYYYDPVHCRNGGFDAALEFSDGYDIFEVKYYRQYRIILSANTASEVRQLLSQNAVPQPPERCLSR